MTSTHDLDSTPKADALLVDKINRIDHGRLHPHLVDLPGADADTSLVVAGDPDSPAQRPQAAFASVAIDLIKTGSWYSVRPVATPAQGRRLPYAISRFHPHPLNLNLSLDGDPS
ncbi:hypothetical protein [Plantactinospora sp. CA-290183]|uniref:hypothetical protein n=1 Tax=Plantactinospora sp. CA-290183 TaxID=3240006 RepID=UPI003D89BDCF